MRRDDFLSCLVWSTVTMKRFLFVLGYLIVHLTIISGKRQAREKIDWIVLFWLGLNHYLGCFIDQIEDRDLEIFAIENEQITPEQCILACRQLNYRYAAIQYGSECRCGDQYGKHGQAPEEECGYACLTSGKCGGDKRNSIYDVRISNDEAKAGRFRCYAFFYL